jgi:hypothetical protein
LSRAGLASAVIALARPLPASGQLDQRLFGGWRSFARLPPEMLLTGEGPPTRAIKASLLCQRAIGHSAVGITAHAMQSMAIRGFVARNRESRAHTHTDSGRATLTAILEERPYRLRLASGLGRLRAFVELSVRPRSVWKFSVECLPILDAAAQKLWPVRNSEVFRNRL